MSLSPAAYCMVADMLKKQSGLHLGTEKSLLVETRLAQLVHRHNFPDLDELIRQLNAGGCAALMRDVVDAMTTNESSFFRDGKPFTHFARSVLPDLYQNRPAETGIKIWSAASSFGQEACSIGMAVLENPGPPRRVEILGTDISRNVLSRARAALYSAQEAQRGLSPQRLARFFDAEGAYYRAKPELRSLTRFQEWNLTHDLAPLGEFDVIFCRNILIYFDHALRRRVVQALQRRLRPGGILYLGSTETILDPVTGLAPLAGEVATYRSIS